MILMKNRLVCKSLVRTNEGGDDEGDDEPPIWIEVQGY